jgi:hypothetical protein
VLTFATVTTSAQTQFRTANGARAPKGSGPPPPSAIPLPNTLGAQSTVIILVNFQDNPTYQPYTVADAQSVVFGAGSSFLLENSYQQTRLTGDVVG